MPVGRDLVLTADVIAPLVDDPATFGAIAAANSLSDVWAMGGEPRFALNLVFFPDDQLPLEVLDAILDGAMRTCAEAGVAVVGGHTVRDAEVKFGLSVTGDVGPDELWSNRTARAGQVLVLTKALGTGVIGQAIKKGIAGEAAAAAAIRSMTTLNRTAARIGHAHGATAATDVTGFGLLGRATQMAEASGVTFELDVRPDWFLPRTLELAEAGEVAGGLNRNREFFGPRVSLENVDAATMLVLFDPQTSGGLLLAVPGRSAAALTATLRRGRVWAKVLGRAVRAGRHPVVVNG